MVDVWLGQHGALFWLVFGHASTLPGRYPGYTRQIDEFRPCLGPVRAVFGAGLDWT